MLRLPRLSLLFVLAFGTAASLTAAPPPQAGRWCQAYVSAARPLHSALDEALDSLGHGWGPDSRGLGYSLHESLLPVAALLPAPDPALDRRLRQALLSLETGAQSCMKSMPMTTRLRLVEGTRALADFESGLAKIAGGVPACLPAWSGREKLSVVVGVEGEGMSLADTPAGLVVPPGGAAGSDPQTEPKARSSAGARSRNKAPKAPKKPAPARPRR
jgi:hypothetical protein